MQVSDGLYDIYIGDLVRASNDYEGSQLVKITEIHDEIGDHCGLEGPGFIGLVLDELTLTPRYELCYTPDMVQSKERQMEEQSPYTNGPYIVLSDGSTFDAAHGCVITYVTDAGQEQLEESCDFKFVETDEIETVTLGDLMSAYEKLHNIKL